METFRNSHLDTGVFGAPIPAGERDYYRTIFKRTPEELEVGGEQTIERVIKVGPWLLIGRRGRNENTTGVPQEVY